MITEKQKLTRRIGEYAQTIMVLNDIASNNKYCTNIRTLASHGLRSTLSVFGEYLQLTALDMEQPIKGFMYHEGGLFEHDAKQETLKTEEIPQSVRGFQSQLKIMLDAA